MPLSVSIRQRDEDAHWTLPVSAVATKRPVPALCQPPAAGWVVFQAEPLPSTMTHSDGRGQVPAL